MHDDSSALPAPWNSYEHDSAARMYEEAKAMTARAAVMRIQAWAARAVVAARSAAMDGSAPPRE